jgi:hypothetical protein
VANGVGSDWDQIVTQPLHMSANDIRRQCFVNNKIYTYASDSLEPTFLE